MEAEITGSESNMETSGPSAQSESFDPFRALMGVSLPHAVAIPAARLETRFVVDQAAVIFVEGAPGQSLTARIRDVSRAGMQLALEAPVAEGSRVQIRWKERNIYGRVRYQRRNGNCYTIGVKLFSSWESLVSEILSAQSEELRLSNLELKNQAGALRRHADLLDLTYDTIMVVGIDGRISFWNHGAVQMYGWSREEAVGRDSHRLLQTIFPADYQEIEAELLGRGRWEGELEQTCKGGSRIFVASRWALQFDEERRPVAIMAINSDITAQKRAELESAARAAELALKNQELESALDVARRSSLVKDRFLASVSHELRTPLNGIIGFTEMLQDGLIGNVTADQKECLSDILSSAHHLLGLINHLLDVDKIRAGKLDFVYEPVVIDQLARDVIESVRAISVAKRIATRLEVSPLVGTVSADPQRLRQVLYNFLSNALKFTQPNGCVSVKICREDETSYSLEVEDNGIGIREQELPQLFTEFGQLCAREKAREGVGLGLALTKQIVEAHGGYVGVHSTFGAGSRFYAVLPMRGPDAAGQAHSREERIPA